MRNANDIPDLLDRIEAEMRRAGLWSAPAPDLLADYDAGRRRTFLDAPSFPRWLQAVFLPRARAAAAAGTLPPASAVGVMALRQWDYHEHVPEAQPLLALLAEFDAAIARRAGGGASQEAAGG